MAAGKLWNREELILAFNLYCKIPFGKMHRSNSKVIELSQIINRTPSAIARKLGNFARFDPALQARGIKGLGHGAKSDEIIWNEFYENWDDLAFESEKLLAEYENKQLETSFELEIKNGIERERKVKTRVNQSFFRTTLLTTYQGKCCITGINEPNLLIAAHIMPWASDEKNRLNPKNGLLLNALHDKAFEYGLIGIDENYRIHISKNIIETNNDSNKKYFLPYNGKVIETPERFFPDQKLLATHFKNRFKG